MVSDSESRQHAVLIVESDAHDRETLRACIAGAGFRTIEAQGIEQALERARSEQPDFVVSEIVLSDGSGFSLCRQLRTRSTALLPIVLTSRWSRESDRILAFECGADDFVAKPFYPRELASRVRAVLRRAEALKVADRSFKDAPKEQLLIDGERQIVTLDGRRVALTFQEFSLLSVMANRRGQVSTRDELIVRAWPSHERPNPRSVDAHVKALRRKLGDFGHAIETVRGVGYRYAESAVVQTRFTCDALGPDTGRALNNSQDESTRA